MRPTRTALAFALLAAAAMPAQAAPAGRWYATQLHAHSTHSDGVHSVDDLVRWAKEGGLDALALTDHQTDVHVADPAWQGAGAKGLVMIPAYEWTRGFHGSWDGGERCHVSVWGLRPGQTPIIPPTASRQEVLATLTAQGLTFGANHPFEPRFPWPDDDLSGVHAVEVWQWNYDREPTAPAPGNAHQSRLDLLESSVRNGRAMDLWRKQLARGLRVTPIATADFHVVGPQRLESPCTLVWSATPTADGILAGIRAGRVALVREPKGPRVEIDADADHDGDFEAIAGSEVPAGTRVRVRATGARGLTLGLWRPEGEVARWEVGTPTWTRTFVAKPGAYFARLDQPRTAWSPLQAMSGALYVANEPF